MAHVTLAKFFDAPAQERMQRSVAVLTPPDAPRGEPILIVAAHPRIAHKAFVQSNERHNGLKLLAAAERSDGWVTCLYEHPPIAEFERYRNAEL